MIAVSDTLSNTPEQLEAIADAIGRSSQRLAVFNAIYHGKRDIKTVTELANSTKLAEKAVLTAGKYLADHRVVNPTKKNGRVAYQKIGFIHKNKTKILGLTDPKKRAKHITKRRIVVQLAIPVANTPTRQLKSKKKLVVLYMLANPDPNPDPKLYIRPEAEARMVLDSVRGSKFRDNVDIQVRVAANIQTILQGLNDHSPQIVHFSGHSNTKSLLMDSGAVTGPVSDSLTYEQLAEALKSTDRKPAVVVLNSCFSAAAQKDILKSVDALVGMADSVSDIAAAGFASQFYAALASGQSLDSAFKQGVVAVAACSITEKSTPKLFVKHGVDPCRIVLT